MKTRRLIILLPLAVMSVMQGCSLYDVFKEGPDEVENKKERPKGSVTMTNLEHRVVLGMKKITATIKVSGVTSSEITWMGIMASTSPTAEVESTGFRGYYYGDDLQASCRISSHQIQSNTTYYVKAFVTTSSGTVYSNSQTVKFN